ncbi:sensor histidine kinase [Nonomuraea sp. NPDC050663]|uniref:sensor histidine kinase n=1 Tax=Nonomuraea sp. NPDC050663 TaxID=3364370 RepID=UPI0037B43BBB
MSKDDIRTTEIYDRLWGWELVLVISIVVPVFFVLLINESALTKATVTGCLLAILPLYVLLGRPAIVGGDDRRGLAYIVVMLALYIPPALISGPATYALFGLCAQCFLALRARWAIAAVVLLCIPPVIYRFYEGHFYEIIVIVTITLFFSSAFGIWATRIIEQSRERAELIKQLEASRAEVARLSAEAGARQERERLAGEIHDTLAQGFSSIIMLLQAPDPARNVPLAVRTARENLAEARALVAALAPAPLDERTLLDSMRRIAGRTAEEIGAGVTFGAEGESRPLPPAIEVVLVRALQEGLSNVRKHAAAREVRVTVTYGTRTVRLRVEDDGVGLVASNPQGYGLRAMRTRVEEAGGTVELAGPPGTGTTLTVEVPA